ncbi:MAG: VWA domain-containing protein [Solirubrobacterales bacterium]|nr:VWA domain-containing protein [Solirubrobacterales bacterium]
MTTPAFGVQTIVLDLPALVGAFGARCHEAGIPVDAGRAARLARALQLTRPVARRRLYWTARAVIVTDPGQVRAFDAAFAEVFGAAPATGVSSSHATPRSHPGGSDEDLGDGAGRGAPQGGAEWSLDGVPASRDGDREEPPDVPAPTVASDEEVLRAKRFDALDADELARLYALMRRLAVAAPPRLARRARRARRGDRIDLRRTLRGSLRTSGDPIALARRRRRVVRRRIVLLCDISGSMEPYARAYLQFLACATAASPAAAGGRGNEAFVFATRLTRLTRALHAGRPERAIARAAALTPDWSSGTRIGDALRRFNDGYGRRGMARGAVVVILSDGWERGDPGLVGREMQRLARLAYRIVWVNPRVAASDFAPRAAGMAAALPCCDALVSGHTYDAMAQVVEAIAAPRRADAGPAASWRPAAAEPEAEDEEPWASAGWVGGYSGSSVAMPSGYGPSRGRTTPGWSLH